MEIEEPNRLIDHPIRGDDIDADALRVLRRLHDYGFYAYLVGGSVRDMLIGRTPKDFDVVTSAQPEEIKKLFRRCRLIGRRFRLAHIMGKDGQIIETATFRAKPEASPDGEIIRDDNQFGTPRSDALRRDFTVNALFFDPHRNEVIDYTDGLQDLEGRVLRTIGDPTTRFREDPVRMLRAVKFAARLDFEIEDAGRRAIVAQRAELVKAALPRLYEEVARILGSGAALRSIELLDELRLLEILIPELSAVLARFQDEDTHRIKNLLGVLDRTIQAGQRLPNGVLFAALLWPVVEAVVEALPEPIKPHLARSVVEELTRPLAIRLCIPRRTMEAANSIMEVQLRFDQIRRKKSSRMGLVRTANYAAALIFSELRGESGQLSDEERQHWHRLRVEHPPPPLFPRRTSQRGRRDNRNRRPRRRR